MPARKIAFNHTSYRLDARPDRFDLRDRFYLPKLVNLPAQYPPEHVIESLFPAYRSLVLNQGNEGACTGFGLAAVINYLTFRDHVRHLLHDEKLEGAALLSAIKAAFPQPKKQCVSPAMIYHLARIYDEWDGEDYEGSSCRGALKGWHKHGICRRQFWPAPTDKDFDSKRQPGTRGYFGPPSDDWQEDAPERPLGAYYRIDVASLNDLQSAIHEVGAVYVSADVHEGWTLDECASLDKAIIPFNSQVVSDGSHAFALVGYTKQGFIVQNSWGESWGVKGFGILTYADWLQHGSDAWAVALGAVVGGASIVTKKGSRLKSAAIKLGDGRGLATSLFSWHPGRDTEEETDTWNPETKAGLARCHQHAIVLDRGQPLERLIIPGGRSTVDQVGHFLPAQWLKEKATRRVVLFAHGGLNQEKAGIERVSKMAPWFLANDIYPIFLVWKTGPWETIGNLLGDEIQSIKDKLGPSGGVLDNLRDRFSRLLNEVSERKDYYIEQASDRVLVRAAWNDMKSSAENAAREGGATYQLALALRALKTEVPNLEIHLIGHSAGTILLGEMLRRFTEQRLHVKSCHLYAAACTIPFANRTYAPALEAGTLKAESLHQHVLSDSIEKKDTCFGIYSKSLLYLVSRGLETPHKMPLLGLAAAVVPKPAKTKKTEEGNVDATPWASDRETAKELEDWRKLNLPVNEIVQEEFVFSQGTKPAKRTHGSFDNDIHLINGTISTILGKDPLKAPVTDLEY
jgi:hypothetical protein